MRYIQLDFIRGVAIVLMIIFHLSFDLNNFHFISIDIYNQHSRDWFYFRMLILSIFMLSVGISLHLTHENKIDFKKVFKRFYMLALASSAISIASYITFPHTWIYFGVIHFVTIASLLLLPFTRLPTLALIVGTTIVILFNIDYINMHWFFHHTASFLHLPHHTEDLVPFTPWLGIVLIGLFLGAKRFFIFPLQKNNFTTKISFLGKHSLAIYLLHQPFFFGLIAGVDYLVH
jgi:uncharacterized membrane protein